MTGQQDSIGPLGLIAASVVAAYSKLAGEALTPYKIMPIQWAILDECARGRGTTATALARVVPIDPASISRNVDRLVRLGLLQRQRLASDRRVVRLAPTDDARAMLPEIAHQLESINATLLDGVTEDERQAFTRTVGKITANAARFPEQAGPRDGANTKPSRAAVLTGAL